ncbi:spermatogenesis-associated serine-rich protein 1 isoform X2 [Brachyhypopomus gauderio]
MKCIKFPAEIKLMRSFPQANRESQSEWTFYPNSGHPVTYHIGKRSFTDKMHHGGHRSSSEQTLEETMGRKKRANPSCSSSSGSIIPEYSLNFHKLGSTLPKSSFGYPPIIKEDTFIPLQPLPRSLCVPYAKKKKIWEQQEEINDVQALTKWRAAPRFPKIAPHTPSKTTSKDRSE